MSTKCQYCDGCGRVADTEEQEPWSAWENLPVKSAIGVLIGLVQPMPCPQCNGTGKMREHQRKEARR